MNTPDRDEMTYRQRKLADLKAATCILGAALLWLGILGFMGYICFFK